jgi:hypothetical protein
VSGPHTLWAAMACAICSSVSPLVSGSRKYTMMQARTTHPLCGGEESRQWQAGAEFRSDQKQDGMSTFLCEPLGLRHQEVHEDAGQHDAPYVVDAR